MTVINALIKIPSSLRIKKAAPRFKFDVQWTHKNKKRESTYLTLVRQKNSCLRRHIDRLISTIGLVEYKEAEERIAEFLCISIGVEREYKSLFIGFIE